MIFNNNNKLDVRLFVGVCAQLFHNPTGSSLSKANALRLVTLAQRFNFYILSDEPYVPGFLGRWCFFSLLQCWLTDGAGGGGAALNNVRMVRWQIPVPQFLRGPD